MVIILVRRDTNTDKFTKSFTDVLGSLFEEPQQQSRSSNSFNSIQGQIESIRNQLGIAWNNDSHKSNFMYF